MRVGRKSRLNECSRGSSPQRKRAAGSDKKNDGRLVERWYGHDMISRHWKGIVKPRLAERYLEHLKTHTIPELAAIPGFISVSILKREVAGGTEFQVVTRWASLDSIRGFAGEDIE